MPRSLQLLVVGLVALALGGVLGWVLKPEPSHTSPISIVDRNEPRIESTSAEPTSTSASQHNSANESEHAQPKTDVSHRATASGTFTGTVRYADGRPCADLLLIGWLPITGQFETDRVKRMSPEERRAFYETAAQHAARTITAKTDASGAFRMEGVGDGTYWLQSGDRNVNIVRESWASRADAVRSREMPFWAGNHLELVALPILRLTLELTMDSGEAVTSAGVTLSHAESGERSSLWWRPDSREHEVSAGTWKVSAWTGPDRLWTGECEVVVPADGLKEPVRLELKGEEALVVRARPPRPFYEPAFVWLVAADKVPAGARNQLDILRLGSVLAVDNNWASQPLRGLAPGRYTAFCFIPGGAIYARTDVEYAGGRQWFDFEMPPPSREDHVVVRVLDPKGGPVLGAAVTLDMDGSAIKVDALAMRSGEYWLRRRTPEELYLSRPIIATDHRIIAEHPRYGQRVVFVPTTQRDVEITLKDVLTLTVKLENLPSDHRDFRLVAYPSGTDGRRELEATAPERQGPQIAERSEFRVQPGRVVVALIMRWGGTNNWPIIQAEVDVAGDQEFALVVPALNALRVHIPGAASGLSVSIRGEQGQSRSHSTVDDRVEFTNLVAGTYTLGTVVGAMTVRVPYSGEVLFEPRPYNCLVLWQFDSGGVLAGAGMRVGDRIRAINGRPLEGTRDELRAAFAGAGAQGDVTLTVDRNAQTLTLNVASAQWRGLQNAGTTPAREE